MCVDDQVEKLEEKESSKYCTRGETPLCINNGQKVLLKCRVQIFQVFGETVRVVFPSLGPPDGVGSPVRL